MFKQELIKAFAISCKIRELKAQLHDLAVARIITEAIYDHDASQATKKALSGATKSAGKLKQRYP